MVRRRSEAEEKREEGRKEVRAGRKEVEERSKRKLAGHIHNSTRQSAHNMRKKDEA